MRFEEVTPRVVHEILLNLSGSKGYDRVVEAALRARFDIPEGLEFTSREYGDESVGVVSIEMKHADVTDEILSFLSQVTDDQYGPRWTRLTVTLRHFKTAEFA